MTWETLQPQEREAWLAEHVMGQCPHPKPWKYYCIEDGNDCDSGFTCPQCGEDMYGKGVDGVPHYTTDPAAALGLLEEMRQRNYFIRIVLRVANHKAEHKYYCYIEPETINEWVRGCTVNADTLPAAIAECCYGALADCPAAARGEE